MTAATDWQAIRGLALLQGALTPAWCTHTASSHLGGQEVEQKASGSVRWSPERFVSARTRQSGHSGANLRANMPRGEPAAALQDQQGAEKWVIM